MNTRKTQNFGFKLKHHIIFWLVYFMLNVIRWGAYYDDYSYSLKSNLIEFSLHITFVYLNIFVLIPKYILKSRYINYILIIIICLGLIYTIKTSLIYTLISKNILPEANLRYRPFGINHIISEFVGELYVLALVSSIYLTLNWLKEREKNKSLNEIQLKMKLKNLENQIQPHFFFNTLNNLYSLSISKSDLVPSTIIRISKLMKFVLYDIKDNSYIPLEKEFEYIQNYIDIQKLRFENIEVITNINSNIEGIQVPPMIFITFVENAFKHGGYHGILKIKINCEVVENNYLIFEIINNFEHSQIDTFQKGIGIENIMNRLKLLYHNDYEFFHNTKLNYYIIKLKIPVTRDN